MKKVFEKSFLILSLLTILSAGCSEFSIRKKFGCYPDYYIPDTKESRKYPWWRSNSERFGSYVNGVYVPKYNEIVLPTKLEDIGVSKRESSEAPDVLNENSEFEKFTYQNCYGNSLHINFVMIFLLTF